MPMWRGTARRVGGTMHVLVRRELHEEVSAVRNACVTSPSHRWIERDVVVASDGAPSGIDPPDEFNR
jgi:hypothetical protein